MFIETIKFCKQFIDLCSHRRSWWFWAESVSSSKETAFHSVRARNWDDFKKGRVDEASTAYMGIDCSVT